MKKLLLICLLFTIPLLAKAQDTVAHHTYQYAEVVANQKMFSQKVNIVIDYGQKMNIWKDNREKDENGETKEFNSVVDVWNYMDGKGWEFFMAFPVTYSSGNVYHYIFRRKIQKQ